MDAQNRNAYKKKAQTSRTRQTGAKRKRSRVHNHLKSDDKIRISFDASNSSAPNLSFDRTLLSNWSFPHRIHRYYALKGITRLFDWQVIHVLFRISFKTSPKVECLNLDGVLEGRNLVYSAPTSAGKSMVADILLYKKLLEHKKKAIIILPFVSVTQEKMLSLKSVLKSVGVRVDAFAGGVNPRGGLARVDVAVCTIEKANNMLNKLIEDNKLHEIGLIVVDELHMIGNSGRGFLLELLLTKVLYLKDKIKHDIQIVGMSATIPNLKDIANWLDAQLFVTDFRPVPLYERAAIGDVIYDSPQMTEYRSLDIKDYGIKKISESDDPNLIYLAIETLVNNLGALVFCATKAMCERLCKTLASNIYEFGKGSKPKNQLTEDFKKKIVSALDFNQINEVLQQLDKCPAGLDPLIASNLRFGVAFHHAGLSMDERSIIEQAFRRGVIKILCATSTLSAGVNLPARLVIIKSPLDFRGNTMDSMTYRQMIGRAGRQGVDTMGESILMCTESNRIKAEELLKSDLNPVTSCLMGSESGDTQSGGSPITSFGGIRRAVLEIIANGTAVNYEDVSEYISKTFLASRSTNLVTNPILDDIIEYLIEEKLIHAMTDTDSQQRKITPTQFGKAVLASGISPKDGSFILSELNKAKASLSLKNELHLLYEVTPINLSEQLESIDWQHFLEIWSKMDEDMRDVGKLVGVAENSLFSLIRKSRLFSEEERLIHKRFYAALALNDLANEVPLYEVSKKFKLNKGVLQSLQQSASSFAGMLTTFCNRLGWHNLEILIDQFQSRLYFGVQRELIDLMRVQSLNSSVARLLFNAKYDTVVSLANVDKTSDIELALMNAGPFDKNKSADTSLIWVPGLNKAMSVREMAKAIVYEAKELVNKDLGIKVYDLSQASSGDSNDEPIDPLNDFSDEDIGVEPIVDNFTKLVSRKNSPNDEYKENVKQLDDCVEDMSFIEETDSCDNRSHSPITSTANASKARIDSSYLCQPSSSSVSTVVSSTPIASTSARSSHLKIKLDAKPKQLSDESFGLGDSLDNISWDQLDKDLNRINETHTEKGDISMKDLSTISTDLVNNRCSSPDLLRDSDVFSNTSDGSSKRSSSPSPSGKAGERLHKRERHFSVASSVSLINSDNSVFTDESSNPFLSDESTDSSVFPKIDFNELKVGDKFNCVVIDGTNPVFVSDMMQKFSQIKTFSMHFKTDLKNNNPLQLIGSRIRSLKTQTQEINGLDMNHNNSVLTSITVCFESERNVFYVTETGLKSIKDKLKKYLTSDAKVIAFDVKMCYKILRQCFGLDVKTLTQIDWFDVQIGHWVLDPECPRPKNVQELVKLRAKSYLHLFSSKNSQLETQCVSTGLMFSVINSLMSELEDKNQLKAYKKTEMPSRLTIADMELNGIAVDLDYMNKQLDLLNQTKRQLEEKAYEVANRRFKLSSPQEVSKVLYEELNLLSNYYSVQKRSQKANAKVQYNRKIPKHLSTSKSALKKLMSLSNNHPMPQIILDWRRVNNAIKKNIKPILSFYSLESKTGVKTINGVCDDWTSTGRIVMCEPNIIGTIKDFVIEGVTLADQQSLDNQTISFSMRKCFVAQTGNLLVSADYSQLELRILAHLSKDKRLTEVLNSGGDVFKSIASVWRSKPIDEITDEERQQSKQIVYGMIYGKGEKSLAEDLEVSEPEAKEFMESFIGRYEGVKQFINKTIEKCREKGYCETLSGRRRYLPHIDSQNMALRAKAERQAVNSTIQGSAADLVKTAMTVLQLRLLDESTIDCRFVLQMYDELMYEVSESCAQQFASLLAECMQTCRKNFRVELPVRVKVGPNWADLKPLEDIQ